MTSPEELLAAAHASCFSMACSNELAKAGTPPTSISVTVDVSADKLDVGLDGPVGGDHGPRRRPRRDAGVVQEAAEKAKDGCPISKALKGNVALSVEATLEG